MSIISQATVGRSVTPHLQAEVGASTTDWSDIASWTVPRDATIESMTLWHVPGSEDALQTKPVLRTEDGVERNIPNYASDGDQYVTGEPNGDQYYMNMEAPKGSQIIVKAKNTNSSYSYRFRVLPVVDYRGGLERAVDVLTDGGSR